MYSVSKSNKLNKIMDGFEFVSLEGFTMSSKSGIKINNQIIRDIKVVDKDFAYIVVYEKVMTKYQKLIDKLTDLITSDDDSGSDLHEALNQIERFRLEIKNKYRSYLKKKDIMKMSRELSALKKEAEKNLIEIQMNIIKRTNSRGR